MHNVCMRTHTDIVRAVGIDALARLTGKSVHTVRSWQQRQRIPAEHWLILVEEGKASADELMAGVAPNRERAA